MPLFPFIVGLFVFVLFLALALSITWYVIFPLAILWLIWSGIQTAVRLARNASADTNGCRLRRTDSPRPHTAEPPVIDVDYTEIP